MQTNCNNRQLAGFGSRGPGRDNTLIVLYAHDTLHLVFMIALRNHIVKKLHVDESSIHLLCPSHEDSSVLCELYGVSSQCINSIISSAVSSGMALEFVCSDSHIQGESLRELREAVLASCQLGLPTTLSLTPDGSANRLSALSDHEIMTLFGSFSDKITPGTFFSFGFIARETAVNRSLFCHDIVYYYHIRDYALVSQLREKEPYSSISKRLRKEAAHYDTIIWVPLRAICNDKGYHGGMYEFGRDNPVLQTLKIYQAIIDHTLIKIPANSRPLIVFVGDVRTKHVLGNLLEDFLANKFDRPYIYIEQPPECRFDFLFGSCYSESKDFSNYVLAGDSTTVIPLAGGYYKFKAILGYPISSLSSAGASEVQISYISDRVGQWIQDAAIVFSRTLEARRGITTSDMDEGLFYLSIADATTATINTIELNAKLQRLSILRNL